MQNNKRLKGMYLKIEDMENYLKMYLNEYMPGIHYVNKEVKDDVRTHYRINVKGQDKEILLITNKRKDGTISVSYKSGKNQFEGKKIVEYIYKQYDNTHSEEGLIEKIKLSQEQVDEILELLEQNERIVSIERKTIDYGIKYIVMGLDTVKINLSHYTTGTFISQGGNSELKTIVSNAVDRVSFISNSRDVEEKLYNLDVANSLVYNIAEEMLTDLGHDIIEYFRQLEAPMSSLCDAYEEKNRAMSMQRSDYSDVVRGISVCYEAILKSMLVDIGIERKTLASSYFYRNKNNGKFYFDRKYYSFSFEESVALGKQFNKFRKIRNTVSHGDNHRNHTIISSYKEAIKQFNEIRDIIIATYNILKKYIK